jgi:hypothetical protein
MNSKYYHFSNVPSYETYEAKVLARVDVELTPAIVEIIEEGYMNADTVAATAKAVKNSQ